VLQATKLALNRRPATVEVTEALRVARDACGKPQVGAPSAADSKLDPRHVTVKKGAIRRPRKDRILVSVGYGTMRDPDQSTNPPNARPKIITARRPGFPIESL
jgi:hypothetical protein